MLHDQTKTCPCQAAPLGRGSGPRGVVEKTARSVPTALLGVLIAFFPKCPVCAAAYMSMFGSVWLASAPLAAWLFPVLIGFSGLNLLLLLRRSEDKGYGPFVLALAGTTAILLGRSLFPDHRWVLVPGMLLMLSGSLLNSFSLDLYARARGRAFSFAPRVSSSIGKEDPS